MFDDYDGEPDDEKHSLIGRGPLEGKAKVFGEDDSVAQIEK